MSDIVMRLRSLLASGRSERVQFATLQQLAPRKREVSDKPIHIVYVLNHIGMCGGTKIILEHATQLTKLGATVTLLSHFSRPDWYPFQANFITIPFQIELTRGIVDCDVIVATYWEHIGACVETGIAPVVYFEQGDYHLYDWESDGVSQQTKNVVKMQYLLAPYVTTVSSTVATLIKNKFGREATVFHNALDESIFYPKDQTQKVDKKYMLIVGREQTKFKGIEDLHKVHKLLREKGYDIELRWITQEPPIHSLGEVYINPPVNLIGDLYRQAYVYVCGSYYEAFPLPPLEAMACGVPVITTNNVGVQEYAQDDYNCLMTELGDIQGLADRIIRLLEDPDLYQRLQQNGYQTAHHFKWEEIAKNLLSYYQAVAQYVPVPQGAIEEWELSYQDEDFIDPAATLFVKKFLTQTAADIVLFPVQHKFLPGRDMISWQAMAKRKTPRVSYIDKVYFPLKGEKFPQWDSIFIADLYRTGKFDEALQLGKNKIQAVSYGALEWAVIARYIIMCLLKLKQDQEAKEWLDRAFAMHPLYTDFYYIQGLMEYRKGNREQANSLMLACMTIQDAMLYPEHFANIGQIANEYVNRGRNHGMISVIMPVYNAARFLKAAIDSILNQTEEHLELIIVNDGSTDSSEDIILAYQDKRIVYVRQENKGEGAAREVALRLAKGDFITFQDGDDISLPYRLQFLKSRFIAPDIGLVHSDMMLIDDMDRPIGYWASSNIESSRLFGFFLKVGTPFNNPTIMLRRESMEDFHYDASIRIGVDSDMIFNVAPQWNSVHIPEPLVLYRRYAQSLSRQGDYDMHALHVRKFTQQHSLKTLFPELPWGQQDECDVEAMGSALMGLYMQRRGLSYDVQVWLNKATLYDCSMEAKKFITAIENIISSNYESARLILEQCTKDDYIIENYLGEVKALLGDFDQAFKHFWRSLELRPLYFEPAENLKALGMCRGGHGIDITWRKFAK